MERVENCLSLFDPGNTICPAQSDDFEIAVIMFTNGLSESDKFSLPWEGLGEGAKLDADRPSPRPLPKGKGEKTL